LYNFTLALTNRKELTSEETVSERATEGYLSDIKACQDFLSGINAAEESDLAEAVKYYRKRSKGVLHLPDRRQPCGHQTKRQRTVPSQIMAARVPPY
jgi:hypothetical protein